jgi:hypothetical protein
VGQKPTFGPWSPVLQVSRRAVLRVGAVSTLARLPTLKDQVAVLWPPKTGWSSYTPRHWAAQGLRRATSPTHKYCEPLRPLLRELC